jgi:hypothetical protein
MSEAHTVLPTLASTEWALLWLVLVCAVAALAYGASLVRHVQAKVPAAGVPAGR